MVQVGQLWVSPCGKCNKEINNEPRPYPEPGPDPSQLAAISNNGRICTENKFIQPSDYSNRLREGLKLTEIS